jgi:hypothetical protein
MWKYDEASGRLANQDEVIQVDWKNNEVVYRLYRGPKRVWEHSP